MFEWELYKQIIFWGLKKCYCHYPGGTGVSVNLLVGILEA